MRRQPAPSARSATIADQLHNLASGAFDRIIGGKKDRSVIDAFYSAPQLRAALDHRRQSEREEPRRDRLSRPCRCRRPRSCRLSDPEFQHRLDAGRTRGGRSSFDGHHHLCPPRQRRPGALVARQRRHRIHFDAAGGGRRARRSGRRDGHGRGARHLRTAYPGLSGAEGKARRTPRRQGRKRPRRRSPGGAVLKTGMQDDRVPALARAARRTRRRRHHLRQDGRRRGEKIPAGASDRGDRHAHRRHRRRAQRRQGARPSVGYRACQYGTLALDDARRSPSTYVHGQSAGLHAARHA